MKVVIDSENEFQKPIKCKFKAKVNLSHWSECVKKAQKIKTWHCCYDYGKFEPHNNCRGSANRGSRGGSYNRGAPRGERGGFGGGQREGFQGAKTFTKPISKR